ncbi:unnamed protein product [Prunus armeniaca]
MRRYNVHEEDYDERTEANPVFCGKLKYPSIKSHRLNNLINQSLNWQHKQCKNPRPNPVINTLFVDHVCEPQEDVPLPLPIENNLEIGSEENEDIEEMKNLPFLEIALLFLSHLDCTVSSDLSPSGKIVASYGLFVFVSIDWEQFASNICSDALSPGAVSLNAAKSPAIEVIDYPCLSKKILFPISDEVKSTVTDPGQSHMSTVAIPNGLPTTVALTLNEGSSPMSTDFHPIWQTILLFGTCVGDIGPPWDVSSGVKLLSRNFRVWNLDTGPMALKVHLLLDYALLFQPY